MRYDIDTILADGNVAIGNRMPSVPDPILTIELNLEIS
jgi:hypothetical protein